MNDDLAASYAHCQRVARSSGSSFYYSFLMLPRRERLAMCALYAFLRRTDDLGDGDEALGEPSDESVKIIERRRWQLKAWRQSLAEAMDGRCDDPVLPALADALRSYSIPIEYLNTAIDGVEMDLDVRRYGTFAELETYCQRVASAVGLACLRVWGCQKPEAEGPARRCGVAFQMTNILRDLKEDAARDRIYLPREDLARFGYSEGDLLAGLYNDRFQRLMQFEIVRTERLYEEARELDRWLAPDRRRVFGSMMAMYQALLAEIKRRDGDVLTARVRLGGFRKMRIAARWLLRPPHSRSAAVGAGLS
jgi:phytoene synthase